MDPVLYAEVARLFSMAMKGNDVVLTVPPLSASVLEMRNEE